MSSKGLASTFGGHLQDPQPKKTTAITESVILLLPMQILRHIGVMYTSSSMNSYKPSAVQKLMHEIHEQYHTISSNRARLYQNSISKSSFEIFQPLI